MPQYRYTGDFTLPVAIELSDGQTYTLHIAPSRWNIIARRVRQINTERERREKAAPLDGDETPPVPELTNGEWIATMTLRWDLEGDNGPLPLDADFIEANVFQPDQEKMILAMQDVLFPNAPKAAATETTPTPGPAVSTSS